MQLNKIFALGKCKTVVELSDVWMMIKCDTVIQSTRMTPGLKNLDRNCDSCPLNYNPAETLFRLENNGLV
jgi:hypothetical protein